MAFLGYSIHRTLHLLKDTNQTEFRLAVIVNSKSIPINIVKLEVTQADANSGCVEEDDFDTFPDNGHSITNSTRSISEEVGGRSVGVIAVVAILVALLLAGIGYAAFIR